jgi:prepilin-type N-terminal cleavage/methylation domain-containing protein
MQGQRPRHQGFTLVEVLVVLGIVLLLVGISAPVLIGPSAGRSLESSARQLASGLEEARLLAQRERVRTRLLLPTTDQPGFGGDLASRAFVVVARDVADTNAWSLRSGWRRLPAGTAVDPSQGVASIRAGTAHRVNLPGGTAGDLVAPYVEFLPNGSASLNPADPAELVVVADATVDGSGTFRARARNLTARILIDPISGAVLVQ